MAGIKVLRQPVLQARIDAANTYEALFVPSLFVQWAPIVADAAEIVGGERVLDVACGTGILAREIALRTGTHGHVAGIDADAGMIAVARRIAPSIDWSNGIAESLPYPDRSFDAVVSQFGLMFFTDRYKALCEMLRVLVPGGRLVVAVWDSLDNIPAYAAEVALIERTAGRAAAAALRAPFSLGDPEHLATLFTAAGLLSPQVRTHHETAQFPSIRSMVEADISAWLPVMGVILTHDQIDRILREAENDLDDYRTAGGRVRFPIAAHIVSAQKHLQQQVPTPNTRVPKE